MQHYVIATGQPYGLSLNEKLMPEYLKDAGYDTHMVGKWHLGMHKKVYTPTLRGFDSHVGVLSALVDYYNHSYSIPVWTETVNAFYTIFNFDYENILFRIGTGTATI